MVPPVVMSRMCFMVSVYLPRQSAYTFCAVLSVFYVSVAHFCAKYNC